MMLAAAGTPGDAVRGQLRVWGVFLLRWQGLVAGERKWRGWLQEEKVQIH
jgi:hypothetical protein